MRSDWVDVSLCTAIDAGELLSRLHDGAVAGAWEEEEGVLHLYWPEATWNPDAIVCLKAALRELGDHGSGQSITIGRLFDRDWNEQWARLVRPVRVGRRVVIRPSWHHDEHEAGEIDLIIDPKQAFGTGRHATTQLLLEWLEEVVSDGDMVLDLGTGTGILAMIALRLGAKQALGVDSDPVAIHCARDYATQNGFGKELTLMVGTVASPSLENGPSYHLVLANLDRGTVLDSAPVLAGYARQGARVLVSGILIEQKAEIESALATEDISMSRVREKDGWIAFEAAAMESCEA
ncbi:MAG: 50S ribosomal protein L11 methyltransferase [Nitrospiraceae bacterium]